jgi:diketogulonate reductase-like aldo/keto reductase
MLMQTSSPLTVPGPIGLGTWKMGVAASQRRAETAAISHALNVGYRLIDTAEMYGDGGAESILGAALESFGRSRRAEVFIVSKVLPENASHSGTVRACQASLKRMGCEYIDLYLLHWPGRHPFADTIAGFIELRERGLIRHWGVSNFDVPDLETWLAAETVAGAGGHAQCNQIYYCLTARGIEFDLQRWQRERGMLAMAYSPLGTGELASNRALEHLARERGATAAQLALAWCVRSPGVVAIPKSVNPVRIEENLRAGELRFTESELAAIDRAFPPPRSKRALEMV